MSINYNKFLKRNTDDGLNNNIFMYLRQLCLRISKKYQ